MIWVHIFPHLKSACLDVARCNGMINRQETEHDFLTKITPVIEEVPLKILIFANAWISTLDDDQRLVLADGEETETLALLEGFEHGTVLHKLLNEVFDNG